MEPNADDTKNALKFLGKQVGLWFAVVSFFAGMGIAVFFFGTGDHQNSLVSTIVTTPLFVLQITILAAVALAVNYMILWVRARKAYDRLGPTGEMSTIQGRVGTPQELPGDNQACGLQFLANSIIIAVVILSFFLMRAQPGVSPPV